MNTPLARLLCVASLLLLQACDRHAPSEAEIKVDDQRAGEYFLPDLNVEKLTRIIISQHNADPLVNLQLNAEHWELSTPLTNSLSVPANRQLIDSFLQSLGNARVLEQKTAEENWYKHLGVDDITATDARGTRVVLASGDKIWQLIIGDKSSTQNGQYWRELDALKPAVMRVDQVLDLPRDALNWMDREIIDLPDKGVATIEINSTEGRSFTLRRGSGEEMLLLDNAAADSNALPNSVQQLVFGLSRLNFDDITSTTTNTQELAQQAAQKKPSYRITFGLFDGTSFILSLYPDATGSWCDLIALDNGQAEDKELVAEINQQLSRWRYHLSSQRTALYTQAIVFLLGEDDG